jgi:hypothetical protein
MTSTVADDQPDLEAERLFQEGDITGAWEHLKRKRERP